MTLSELIDQAQEMMLKHGDLDVLDIGKYSEVSSLRLLEVESDDDFPLDWNLPKGTKVCLVNYDY
jgi:hypothetical protein